MAQNNRLTKHGEFVSKAQRKERMPGASDKTVASGIGKIVFRIFLSLFTLLLCFVIAVLAAAYVVLNGPCKPLRDRLVLSAMQASATKWVPGLFLPGETVDEIVANSYVVNTDVISLDEYEKSKEDTQTTED